MTTGSAMDDVLSPRVLREYALVADGERGALIGPDGSVAWLCAPRWDSPAVFSGLLGGAGRYTVTPADPWHVWGGYYEPGTLIWRSRWVAAGGPSAARPSPCPPTRTGRCCCAGSRRSTGRPRSPSRSTCGPATDATG